MGGLGPPNSKFISSPARKGWGSAVLVSQGSNARPPHPPAAGPQLPADSGTENPISPGPGADAASCPLSAAGGSSPVGKVAAGSRRGRGFLVAHACGTGTMICALLGGGPGGVRGDSVLWLGSGASKVHHQVRNRGGSGSIDRGGILSVLWFQEDRMPPPGRPPRFLSAWGEGTGWRSPCPWMDSDVTWRRPLPWGLILLGEAAHPSLLPSLFSGWKDPRIFSPTAFHPAP